MALIATHLRTLLGGSSATAASSAAYQQLNPFGDVYERVCADYIEKPDDSKLVASAINGMLAGLDPHSSYLDPGSLRDLQVQTRGEFGGLGIEVTMDDGLVARRLADIRRGTLKKTAATLRNQPDAAQAEERLLSVLRKGHRPHYTPPEAALFPSTRARKPTSHRHQKPTTRQG